MQRYLIDLPLSGKLCIALLLRDVYYVQPEQITDPRGIDGFSFPMEYKDRVMNLLEVDGGLSLVVTRTNVVDLYLLEFGSLTDEQLDKIRNKWAAEVVPS